MFRASAPCTYLLSRRLQNTLHCSQYQETISLDNIPWSTIDLALRSLPELAQRHPQGTPRT
jgi:hypothetical protein